MADAGVPWIVGLEILGKAQSIFRSADMVSPEAPFTGGWPVAANRMFLFTAEYVQRKLNVPWFWWEADAIPLRAGWLNSLEAEYASCGKPFMGAVISAMLSGLSFRYLNGVAVYPANAYSIMEGACNRATGRAFDIASVAEVLPKAADTPLIHCHWGLKEKPPIFAQQPDSTRENVVALSFIRPEAVLFHRNKDGSLIRLLRRKLAPTSSQKITVALPYCNKDAEGMLKLLHWMRELHGPLQNPAVMIRPRDVVKTFMLPLEKAAAAVFSPLKVIGYRGTSSRGWPEGANQAFQATAASMVGVGPWLWLEPDAIPLRPDWLDILSMEYAIQGKPYFGPIVEIRGHMNGVGIYPHDMANRCPKTMSCTNLAFDWVMRPEMIHECYDASTLIQHCWGITAGRPDPVYGEPAHFATQKEVANWLEPDAVLFHRCKNGSLIDRLRERRHANYNPDSQLPIRQAMASILP